MFYRIVKFIVSVILRIVYRIQVTGLEKVPKEGKLIVCGNHSNNLDPVVISIIFPRVINWMAKKELFKFKWFGFILNKLYAFPVNRDGSDIKSIKKSLKVLKEEKVLGLFPEGTKVKDYDVSNAKPGVALLAIRSHTNILPLYIDSNYKLFSKIHIKIGDVINVSEYQGQKLTNDDYTEISQNLLKTIYGLRVK